MNEAHELGKPVMRTMFYEFPQDEMCWDLTDQYMFGSDILAAPILYENTYERDVYLPRGASWTLIYDGTKYEEGQIVHQTAGIDQIPVFLRDESQRELIGKI